jgi:hypothetical protein
MNYISDFEFYQIPIIEYLFENKIFHYDKKIRKLSSNCFYFLTLKNHSYIMENILPKLMKNIEKINIKEIEKNQGIILTISNILLGLKEKEIKLEKEMTEKIILIVPNFETQRYLTKIEIKESICLLIQNISISEFNLPKNILIENNFKIKVKKNLIDIYLNVINDGLKSSNSDISLAFSNCLFHFLNFYFNYNDLKKLFLFYLLELNSSSNISPFLIRGYILALSNFSFF